MLRWSSWLLFLLIFVFSAAAVSAQEATAAYASAAGETRKDEGFFRRVSFEIFGGSYTFPDLLLEIELEKHPRKLAGSIFSVSGTYRLGKKEDWFFFAEFNRVAAFGKGDWAEEGMKARLAEMGVAGSANGRLAFSMREAVAGIEKCFFSDRRLQFCPRTGGGVGWIEAEFQGEFTGVLRRGGFIVPIREPARDLSRRTIPIFSTHLMFRWSLDKKRRTVLSCGPYWNTGHGITCGFKFKFR